MLDPKLSIIFPIEIASRELLYKCYLANLFAANGYNCYLGSKRNIAAIIEEIGPFVYFDKGYHKGVSEFLHKKIKAAGGVVVSLDEEGAVDFNDNSTLLGRYDEKLFSAAEIVFFWGDYQRNLLGEKTLQMTRNVVSGHPRFELLKPEYHRLYDSEVSELRSEYGSFILINTNMGFGNNLKGDDFVLENYGSRFNNIESIVANDKIKLKKFISLIMSLADQYDDNIVLRPHPEEDLKAYTDAFKGIRNIKVIFEKSVIPWLVACEQMIHTDCTTGIEALMIGKRPIAYVPNDLDMSLLTVLPLKASKVVTTEEEVISLILSDDNQQVEDSFDTPLWLEERFAFNKNSAQVIVESVSDLNEAVKGGSGKVLQKKVLYRLKLREIVRQLTGRKNMLVSSKLKGFSFEEVKRIQTGLLNLLKVEEDTKVECLLNDLIRFSPQNR